MNFGARFFHDRVDIVASSSDDVRMSGETDFHRQFDWIKLQPSTDIFVKFI
jgi:hypothetical protein